MSAPTKIRMVRDFVVIVTSEDGTDVLATIVVRNAISAEDAEAQAAEEVVAEFNSAQTDEDAPLFSRASFGFTTVEVSVTLDGRNGR